MGSNDALGMEPSPLPAVCLLKKRVSKHLVPLRQQLGLALERLAAWASCSLASQVLLAGTKLS